MWEWNDAVVGLVRGLRGGAWNSSEFNLRSSFRTSGDDMGFVINNVGIRVVIAPEPSTVAILTLGIALLAWRRK